MGKKCLHTAHPVMGGGRDVYLHQPERKHLEELMVISE